MEYIGNSSICKDMISELVNKADIKIKEKERKLIEHAGDPDLSYAISRQIKNLEYTLDFIKTYTDIS